MQITGGPAEPTDRGGGRGRAPDRRYPGGEFEGSRPGYCTTGVAGSAAREVRPRGGLGGAAQHARGHEDHQLPALIEDLALLEGPAEIRNVAQDGHLPDRVLGDAVGDAADHEALALLDGDLRLRLALVDGGR